MENQYLELKLETYKYYQKKVDLLDENFLVHSIKLVFN